MSLIERTFREQVCPATLPEPGEGDETGEERGFSLLHDQSGSFRLGSERSSIKIVRDVHKRLSVKSTKSDGTSSRVGSMKVGSQKEPPPAPAELPMTDEVRASLAAASMRRVESGKSKELLDEADS